ncbi:unnamed protein product [Meganyctiphanes norvegica]|uniref:Uncharacterized protein n=1 Tax=Meganyctiphanes norvegica TaxID=48144 RepID=A0AAV2SUH1_MEGNR
MLLDSSSYCTIFHWICLRHLFYLPLFDHCVAVGSPLCHHGVVPREIGPPNHCLEVVHWQCGPDWPNLVRLATCLLWMNLMQKMLISLARILAVLLSSGC